MDSEIPDKHSSSERFFDKTFLRSFNYVSHSFLKLPVLHTYIYVYMIYKGMFRIPFIRFFTVSPTWENLAVS